MRPSAAERELVIRSLRTGLQEERLSLDTFSGRIDAAFAARTRAELDELVVDLDRGSALGRAIEQTARRLSGLTVRLRAAWREPRTPRLPLPLQSAVTLGRSLHCDCVLPEPTVSRTHALLRYYDGTWLLRDLGSTNGTQLNGWRVVEEVEVRVGDSVTFGDATYRLAQPR